MMKNALAIFCPRLVKIFYVTIGLNLFCFCKPNVLQPLQQNSTADNGNNGTSSLQNGNTGNSNVSANSNASGNPNVSNDSGNNTNSSNTNGDNTNAGSSDSSDCSPIFPLKDISHVLDFAPGTSRGFGDNRPPKRAHAGCDLYAPLHTSVYAVCDGEILGFYPGFCPGASEVEIKHPNFIARYGEVENEWIAGLKVNDHVKQGQEIATVGHCTNVPASMTMVHFELYTGQLGTSTPLTDRSSTIKAPSGFSYQRRADLENCYDDTNSWYTNAKGN